jgi:hypothetical protein
MQQTDPHQMLTDVSACICFKLPSLRYICFNLLISNPGFIVVSRFKMFILSFTYMDIKYQSPPLFLSPQPLGRTCSTILFSDFVEEKMYKTKRKMHCFCYFDMKTAI